MPTLVLVAGSDWVVQTKAQREYFEGLSSPVKRLEGLPGFYHAIFHEKDRHVVVAKVRDFLRQLFDQPPPTVSLLDADRHRYTKDAPPAPR